MGEKGRVIGIDHIHDLVDMSIANVKKDKPDLLKSQRVKLFGKLNFLNISCCIRRSNGTLDSRRWSQRIPGRRTL